VNAKTGTEPERESRMLHRIIAVFCTAAALFAAAGERHSAPDPKYALTAESLLSELRRGGYTLYFRHTATDFAQNDSRLDLSDCATQRNLSERGREQARTIGAALRALALPLGEVIASPYCRTMETARLMTGRAEAQPAVRGIAGTTGARDYTELAKILATPPAPPATLRLIAGHGNPFRAIAGAPHLEEGEAAVLRGLGDTWVVVARIKAGDWAAMNSGTDPELDRGRTPN
jgi:phosphohistidine phosphatase SixA